MSPISITKQLQDVSIDEGDSATLAVSATTDQGGTLSYSWTKDGEALSGDAAKYLIEAARPEDGGRYVVNVSDGTGEATSSASIRVHRRELLWVPKFVVSSAVTLAVVFGLVLVPLWVTASDLLGEDPSLATVIALQLMILGTLALFAGFYLAFLEFRGRARTAEELLRRPPAGGPSAGRTFGIADKVAEAIPGALKEFGKLQAPAALMVVAVALYVSAAAIAWRSLPDPSPSQTTPTEATPEGGRTNQSETGG